MANKTCPSCQMINPDDFEFCLACGESLPAVSGNGFGGSSGGSDDGIWTEENIKLAGYLLGGLLILGILYVVFTSDSSSNRDHYRSGVTPVYIDHDNGRRYGRSRSRSRSSSWGSSSRGSRSYRSGSRSSRSSSRSGGFGFGK